MNFFNAAAKKLKLNSFLIFLVLLVITSSSSADDSLLVIAVNPKLFFSVQSSLEIFKEDLQRDGYRVEIWHEDFKEPAILRNRLKERLSSGLVGCILVGKMPYVWFETPQANLLSDIYFMDLNGQWADNNGNGILDSHSGDIGPDIWISRIDASTLSGYEADLVNNYFLKNRRYRTNELFLPKRALVYIIPDAVFGDTAGLEELYERNQIACATSIELDFFQKMKKDMLEDAQKRHSGEIIIVEPGETRNEYVNRLKQGYEWITLWVHSNSQRHNFGRGGFLSAAEIGNIDPKGLFFNLDGCFAGQFLDRDYLAGRYLFSKSYSLIVIGKTAEIEGGITDRDFFHQLRGGASIGGAFRQYIRKYPIYGLVLLGDGTLKIK